MNAKPATVEVRPAPASTFHDDAESLPEYRSLSVLALVSLVFGLAAPFCFAAPVLLVIPLFGTALALLAVRRIDASAGALAGRWAAVAGLALCVGSVLALVGYHQVKARMYVADAGQFARNWLAMVQAGETEKAFRLTPAGAEPAPLPTDPNAPKRNPYDDFVANPLIQRLIAIGPSGEVRLDATLNCEPGARGTCLVAQRYALGPASAASAGTPPTAQSLSIDLKLQRARLRSELYPRWLVVEFSSPQFPPDAQPAH